MKARMVALLVMLGTLAILNVPSANAGVAPITAVNAFFAAVDAGDNAAAAAAFTPDAVATLLRGETYRGPDGIAALVEVMGHPGRYHEIVEAHMVGDTVNVVVALYDRGVRWGEETIAIEVQGGELHRFHEQALHLRLR